MTLVTNYTQLRNLRVDLFFNQQEVEQFRPLTITIQAEILTTEGARRDLQEVTTVGNLTAQPLTAKQIYTQIGTIANMHTRLQTALKNFYLDAIGDDISA